jgi:hypothetical protein
MSEGNNNIEIGVDLGNNSIGINTCGKCGFSWTHNGWACKEAYTSSCLVCSSKQLNNENDALKAELKQKDEKLSELTHGIPIEKADKEKVYFFVSPAGLIWRVTWSEPNQEWLTRSAHDRDYEPLRAKRVYPLPSQTQEGS